MRQNLFAICLLLLICASTAQVFGQNQSGTEQKPSANGSVAVQEPAKFSEQDEATEFKRLAGVWRPSSAMLAGDPVPDEVCRRIELQLKDGQFKSFANGVESSGKIKLDLSQEPRGMDITIEDGPEKGKTIKCVYKFEGEKLHVAYSLAFDEVRPAEFVSNQDNKLLLIVYEFAGKDPQPLEKIESPAEGDKVK